LDRQVVAGRFPRGGWAGLVWHMPARGWSPGSLEACLIRTSQLQCRESLGGGVR
jgi:hypothetical protein